MITQERLKELLDYDPESGIFTWKKTRKGVFTWKKTRKGVSAGSMAGRHTHSGYIIIKLDQKAYRAHRLAWLYVHGSFPEAEIDHINRCKDDNRIANLRAATRSENLQNRPKQSNNTSGAPGVSWHNQNQKWRAQITHLGRQIHIGYYNTLEEAAIARASAKAEYHKFHPEDDNVSLQKAQPDYRDHLCRNGKRL